MSSWIEMGEGVKDKLKKCGQEVKMYPLAKIVTPEVIEIGDYCMVDDFTLVYGGKGVKIGRYVHIASFVSIIGGGIRGHCWASELSQLVAAAAGRKEANRVIQVTNTKVAA